MNIDLQRYQGFSKALDALPQYAKEATRDIIWSYRSGNLSVAWVTEDLDIFTEICGGQVPDIVAADTSTAYFVDLESLSSDGPTRIYTNYTPDPLIDLKGYYFASLSPSAMPLEMKIYKKAHVRGQMLVDRYEDGKLISADEVELKGNQPRLWTGPSKLLDLARSGPDEWWLFAKQTKDQSYIRIYN